MIALTAIAVIVAGIAVTSDYDTDNVAAATSVSDGDFNTLTNALSSDDNVLLTANLSMTGELTIVVGKTLTIGPDATLYLSTYNIVNNGTLSVEGKIDGAGAVGSNGDTAAAGQFGQSGRNITGDGNINCSGTIALYGGAGGNGGVSDINNDGGAGGLGGNGGMISNTVTVSGSGAIDLTGGTGGNGGNAMSGSKNGGAGGLGGNGGMISNTVTVSGSGAINLNGGAGGNGGSRGGNPGTYYGPGGKGGDGGAITNNVTIETGTVSLNGGAGGAGGNLNVGGAGGKGGLINSNVIIETGTVYMNGGAGGYGEKGGAGGDGGVITHDTTVGTGTVSLNGGKGSRGNTTGGIGGKGGSVSGIATVGDGAASLNGGDGGSSSMKGVGGGDGGTILTLKFSGAGTVSLNGGKGGSNTATDYTDSCGGNGGNGGSVTNKLDSSGPGKLMMKGGDGGNCVFVNKPSGKGGNGGNIINLGDISEVDVSGGKGGDGKYDANSRGGDGGNIDNHGTIAVAAKVGGGRCGAGNNGTNGANGTITAYMKLHINGGNDVGGVDYIIGIIVLNGTAMAFSDKDGAAFTIGNIGRTGCSFKGFCDNSDPNGAKVYCDAAGNIAKGIPGYTNNDSPSKWISRNGKTLYAVWQSDDAPSSAPILTSVGNGSITITPADGIVFECSGVAGYSASEFTGLTNNQDYTINARKSGGTDCLASEPGANTLSVRICVINFVLGEGVGNVPTLYKPNGVQFNLPTPTGITKTGYTIGNNWHEDQNCGDAGLVFGSQFTPAASKNFYLKWTPITYTLAFDMNGSSEVFNGGQYKYGDAVTLTKNPSPYGINTFVGWKIKDYDAQKNANAVWGYSSTPSAPISADTVFANLANVSQFSFKNLTIESGGTVTLTATWDVFRLYFSEGINVKVNNVPVTESGRTAIVPSDTVSYTIVDGYTSFGTSGLYLSKPMSCNVYLLARKTNEPDTVPYVTVPPGTPGESSVDTMPACYTKFLVGTGLDVTLNGVNNELLNKSVVVKLSKADAVADRYEFTLYIDNMLYSGNISMRVTVPYDPSKGVPSVYWDNNGARTLMETEKIDSVANTITFRTNHNSTYIVTYTQTGTGTMPPVVVSVRISFDANGGSVTYGDVLFRGGAYGDLPNPYRSGYTFAGWYYEGSPVTSGMALKTRASHTLVAEWIEDAPEYEETVSDNAGIIAIAAVAAVAAMVFAVFLIVRSRKS